MVFEQIDPAEVRLFGFFSVVGAGLLFFAPLKIPPTPQNSKWIKGSFWVGFTFIYLAGTILFDVANR